MPLGVKRKEKKITKKGDNCPNSTEKRLKISNS
jgi:hypothetical protein